MFSGVRFFLKNIQLLFSTFKVNILSLSQKFTLSTSLLIAISLLFAGKSSRIFKINCCVVYIYETRRNERNLT